MRLLKRIRRWFGQGRRSRESSTFAARRGRVDHVIVLDGTLSSLRAGQETNAGLTYKLLCEMAPSAQMSLTYEPGVQWMGWRSSLDVINGRGINRQIRRAYGFLASRYRPGDRIFLIGYSRGAYAARSLAGVIDMIGLLRSDQATVRNIRQAYRHYQLSPQGPAVQEFRKAFCHGGVDIEMIGVWDTVKALGLRAPLAWRFTEGEHRFHNHALGPAVRHGYHALALDETRQAFAPVMWTCPEGWDGTVEQMWFRGAHGDVGGQLGGQKTSRPLSNIPLVWMLERAEALGLSLPDGWRSRFPRNAGAPAVGSNKGWGRLFLARKRRIVGADPSEMVHDSARGHKTLARVIRADLDAILCDQVSRAPHPARGKETTGPEG